MSELAAVIVDTRSISLFQIISDHLYYLPKYTKLYIFSSENNRHLQELLNCEFHVVNINSIDDYNNLLTSESFWEKIKEENILIFQEDSRLLREGIEDFYQYDYIGAPIKHIAFPAMNGGLSFRHKSAMIKALKYYKYAGGNEDMFFCSALKNLNCKLPSVDIADQFSVETKYILGSWGYHAIDKWLTPEQCKQIKKQYEHIIN